MCRASTLLSQAAGANSYAPIQSGTLYARPSRVRALDTITLYDVNDRRERALRPR